MSEEEQERLRTEEMTVSFELTLEELMALVYLTEWLEMHAPAVLVASNATIVVGKANDALKTAARIRSTGIVPPEIGVSDDSA